MTSGEPSIVQAMREIASLKAQLTAAEQRAEQAEAWQNRAIDSAKEIATVECIDGVWWAKCRHGGLYGPQAAEREAWLEVAEMRLTAAEAEVKRLREGIRKKGEELRTGTFCRMCEHMQGMCDCKEISAEYDALLAQPSDGKEAGDE